MADKKRENFDGVARAINNKRDARMKRKDWKILAILLVVVTLVSIVNFADFSTPETGTTTTDYGQYVILEIPDGASLGEVYYYAGISDWANNTITFYTSTSLTESSWVYKSVEVFDNTEIYRWVVAYDFGGITQSQYVIIKSSYDGATINEIVFSDSVTGEAINVSVVESTIPNAGLLFDESKTFDGTSTNTNGMMFDEIYFARTAYEILNGMEIFETSHPHLGKLLIATGVAIFGMNPFGYRIMGLLFSIFAVFVMYLLGKKVFKRTLFASLVAVIFACDGLRYVEGRIGTVDSFLLVFIMLAFYFMYDFYSRGMDINSIKRSLLPFAISGIFFGLAVSVKWSGAYTAIGLCALFLIVFFKTIAQRKPQLEKLTNEKDKQIYKKRFANAIFMMIFTGVMFYLVIPFATYYSVYSIVAGSTASLADFWQTQLNMLSYHSGVTSEHVAASPFWSWIFNGKGVLMYEGSANYSSDMYSRIMCMTITAIAVYGVISLCYFAKKFVYYQKKKHADTLTKDEIAYFQHMWEIVIFFLCGMLCSYVPWMVISRSTYIYHFLPSMPFYIGLIGCYLYSKTLLQREVHYSGEMVLLNGKKGTITVGENILKTAIILCCLNFILFFPVFSGIPIAKIPAMFMFGWANGFWGYGLFPYEITLFG